ncbi:H-X9-DG-CTERM domain-containing protein [Armatimonas sp.]|uniref:H-X9-DG-CTERM domain-containing protein n=1 Tax=Armatimonas sp. TaxID=1872638 RepID=UPI003750E656
MKRQYFTLIEIIIVIAIIGILSGILLPVISASQRKSRATKCISNMHQISIALRIYTDDYDGYYPSHRIWEAKKIQGLNNNLACPEAQGNWRFERDDYPKYGVPGYGLNSNLTYIAETLPLSTTGVPSENKIGQPGLVILLTDAPYKVATLSGYDPFLFNEAGRQDAPEKSWLRHSGGAHYLFCDGHIKWLNPEQVWDGLPIGSSSPAGMPRFTLE